MHPIPLNVALAGALLASACTTTLKVHRIDPEQPSTFVGAPYPLMFTRFEVEVTRQVVACPPGEMTLLERVAIKSADSAPDPKQLFAIDTNSLANALKTSEVKLVYLPSGAVSSLNATAEDRSVQVIANVVSAGVNLMKLTAAAGGLPPLAQPQQIRR